MTRKILIDCQILQTADEKRGMGLYLYNLLENLTSKDMELIFILTSHLEISSSVKSYLEKRGRVIILELNTKTAHNPTYLRAFSQNTSVLTQNIEKKGLSDSLFFIPALFSDQIYPVFPEQDSIHKTILVHDLIPYLFHEDYFPDKQSLSCKDYLERYRTFYKSDYYFTNSDSTANDLASHLGMHEDRLVPILGAGSSRKDLEPKKPNLPDQLLKRFILMPSGDDFRKNNLMAAKAMTIVNSKSNKKYSLLVTSNFSEGTKNQLKSVNKDIHFTGVVSEEELLYLLQKSELVIFPTLYEGLGMPILEAREAGAKVACSDIQVFHEISDGTLNFFDPEDASDIAETIMRTVTKKTIKPTVNKNYSWPEVANKFTEFTKDLKPKKSQKKAKIAVFTPDPSSRSAIGLVTQYTHSELSKIYDVDYFFESGLYEYPPSRLNTIKYCQEEQDRKKIIQSILENKYDKVVYHIGNSEFHIHSILTALKKPGTIILHDTQLKGIFDLMVNKSIIPPERYLASEAIMQISGNQGESGFLETLVNGQESIVCHSNYSKEAVLKILTKGTKVSKLELPIRSPMLEPKSNKDTGSLNVGFGGILSADKGLDLLESLLKIPKIKITIFGFSGLSEDLVKKHKGKIKLKTNLTDYEFLNITKSMDLMINFRQNYNGETSLSVLNALSVGIPSIVNDIGWYSELPDEVAFKIKNSQQVVDTIKNICSSKLNNKSTLKCIDYIKYNHSIKDYIKGI